MLGIPSADQISAMEQAAADHLMKLESVSAADAQALVKSVLAAAQTVESATAQDLREVLTPVLAELAAFRQEIQALRLLASRIDGATFKLGPVVQSKALS